MRKISITLFLFLIVQSAIGQSIFSDALIGPTFSYQQQHVNMTKWGAYLLMNPSKNLLFKVDASANLTRVANKSRTIPEIGFTYYQDIKAPFFLVTSTGEVEVTPYTLTPKVGVSLLTIVDIAFGYGIKMKDIEEGQAIKGFTFSVGVNVPLNVILGL